MNGYMMDSRRLREKNQDLADIEAGWRRLLFNENDHLMSFQLTSFIPSGYDLEDIPQLG